MPCTFYRITVELPCIVAFPSATYHVLLTHCIPAGRHNLPGHDNARATDALIGPDYRSREALVSAVFETVIPVRVDTIGATIMRKMVRERWAVVAR